MPKCINDPKRFYTGKEPSPKGLGYCAHSEKFGEIKIGKDGSVWIIQKTSTGSKRWIKNKKQNMEKPKYKENERKLINDYKKLLTRRVIKKPEDVIYFNKLKNKLATFEYDWLQMYDINLLKKNKINKKKFTITGNKLLITDPMFKIEKNNKQSLMYTILDVMKGSWVGYYQYFLTERPNVIIIYNNEFYKLGKHKLLEVTNEVFYNPICIESGIVALIDYKQYPKTKIKHIEWFNKIKKKMGTRLSDSIDGGYVCVTGYGEGCYKYIVTSYKKKVVQIKIFFIP